MSALEIRTLPISELKPAPYNPRRVLSPTSPAYRKLKASVAEFGLVEPLVWNELTGHVVGGHARLRVLKELGYAEVPVSVVRLTDAREKALNVVLNNQEAQGRYDPEKLADLLAELGDGPELELTGFDSRTLAALRFEPATDLPTGESDTDRVEVTLVTDAATYERLAPSLEALVGEFHLVTHLRRG
jgi:ParB-like chromosome segregation protein Spo0J